MNSTYSLREGLKAEPTTTATATATTAAAQAPATSGNQPKYRYTSELHQMLFVFGEVPEPLTETVMLMEDIVRAQVIEIVVLAAVQANKRGSRYVCPEDLIFLIRRNRAKVNRLRTYLSWKDVRKNAKESGEQEAPEEVTEESVEKQAKTKRMQVKLSWELTNSFIDVLESDSEEDDDTLEAYRDSIQRLKDADEITKAMTRDEYVHYSECRQASFTYRKAKRFREWCHMNSYLDVKPNDDVIDILGFLTFEMVSKLTETALSVKREREQIQNGMVSSSRQLYSANNNDDDIKDNDIGNPKPTANSNPSMGTTLPSASGSRATNSNINNNSNENNNADASDANGVDTSACNLFSVQEQQTPILPMDVHEAFRRLQRAPQPLRNFRGGLSRNRIALI